MNDRYTLVFTRSQVLLITELLRIHANSRSASLQSSEHAADTLDAMNEQIQPAKVGNVEDAQSALRKAGYNLEPQIPSCNRVACQVAGMHVGNCEIASRLRQG